MKLKDYVSSDGQYIIPVSWECFSTVTITGVKNLEEALEVAQDYIDDIPLPVDSEYIDGSFKIEEEGDEDYLIMAQDFRNRGAIFENPRNND